MVASYPCFLEVLLTSTQHNTLSKPLAAFQHNNITMNKDERGVSPVAVTIINPWKENWPRVADSNQ